MIQTWLTDVELAFLKGLAAPAERIVQIGTWRGRSTKEFCEASSAKVFTVDHWQGSVGDETAGEVARVGGDAIRAEFLENLKDELYSQRVMLFEGDRLEKKEIIELILGLNSVDLLYIDGPRTEAFLKPTLESYFNLMKKGGIVCGFWANVHEVFSCASKFFSKVKKLERTNLWWAIL